MKLKSLTIHNIASIEDATIDFAGQQLASQDLFLICGPTGAGKSTILDAICLALFDTTPRINSTDKSKNNVINAFEEDNAGEINKVKDTMHLVRKNAPDAAVTLTFEDVDGKECTALWNVKRKIRKSKNNKDAATYDKETLEEKLRRGVIKEWTFTDGDGVTHEKEVEALIRKAIGMNFDQFCKTTMLAQGDFTKFLSSSSDEKAQILEKLVGAERYGAVGRVINQTTNDKKNEVAVLRKELENIKFLSEDDIKGRNEKMAILTSEITELGKAKTSVATKLKWIEDSRKAASAVEAAKDAVTKAEEALAADDVKADAALADLWLKTTELRTAMKTQEGCALEAEKQRMEKARLEEEFKKAVAGLNALNLKAAALNKEIGAERENIAKQSPFEDMFAHASVICKAHEDIITNQKSIGENEPRLAAFDKEISELEVKAGIQQKAKTDAENEVHAAETKHNALQEELKKHGADSIEAEVGRLNAQKLLVSQTESAVETWKSAQGECAEELKAWQNAKEKQTALNDAATKAAAALAKAETAYKASKGVYEKTKASVEDHAKVLRAALKVGDHCPVCGKRVEEVLDDETFVAMLKPLEDAFRKDEAAYFECTQGNAKAKAEAGAGETAVKAATTEVEKANAKLERSLNALRERCETLSIAYDDNVSNKLAVLKSADMAAEAELGKRQMAIKDVRTQMVAVTKEITDIRKKKLDVAVIAIETINKEISRKKLEKQTLATKIHTAKTIIKAKQQEIDDAVNPEWQPAVEENYFTELQASANAYVKAKEEIVKKQNSAEQYKNDSTLMANCKHEVLLRFADWARHEDVEAREAKDVTALWTRLQSRANVLASDMAKTAAEKQKADVAIQAFIRQNSDIEMDAVRSAMAYSARDIEQKQKRIRELNDAMLKAKAGLEAAEKLMKGLSENPLTEGETSETLSELQRAIAEQEQAKNQQIGSIKQELATDADNRKAQGEKKLKLENLQAEYAEWSTLDKYLGSTDGKNFRNVAQSFILGDLLDKANAYLENITGRYTLFCNPGTLTIMMRDAYQGGVVRPTNTLSGGESFIISLSLALGLSSMQSTGFEVDTLFIDEGFGTLSPEFLDPVITSLKRLYEQYGRRVGIISHVETLKARIPVTIEVTREGNSSSRVEILTN